MPDFDLEPGDYRDRKPKGWRWRLPWSHAGDTKLPMVMFFLCAGFVAYFMLNLPAGTNFWIVAGSSGMAFAAGCQFMLWLGRDD